MQGAIDRFIHFIAWQNFVRPAVYVAWAEALALLVLVAWVALGAGDLFTSDDDSISGTDTLVITFATGLALWAMILFALALAHAYRPAVLACFAVASIAAPAVRRRSGAAIIRPGRILIAALRQERWLWVVFVACSLSALLPSWRWDETAYHLAQAEQWVRAGGLTVDPYLRYPLNVCNWQLLQGVALMLHSASLVHLLTWLSGALATLCVRLCLQRLDVPSVVSYPAAVAFFVTPLVQSILTVGLLDVPLMFWLTVSVYAVMRLRDVSPPSERQAAGAALCAAMFVGMKITAILFGPLFIALALYRFRGTVRTAYLLVFVLAGAPWYVRNIVLGGDPMPPVMGKVLHRPSPYWSDWDRDAQAADLHAALSWSPTALASLPVRTLESNEYGPLRGAPFLGYILVFPFSILTVSRLRRLQALDPLVGAWYGAVVWVATSYHLRYAMFLPLATVAAAYTVYAALPHPVTRRRWAVVLISIGLLIGPTPAAAQYITDDWARPIPIPGQPSTDSAPCDDPRIFTSVVAAPARVYLVDLANLKFALELKGYRAIGDNFHDGRWTDFWQALDAGRPGAFLTALPADYVLTCRDLPASRAGLWRTVTQTLAGDSLLVPVVVDSLHAVLRIRHPR